MLHSWVALDGGVAEAYTSACQWQIDNCERASFRMRGETLSECVNRRNIEERKRLNIQICPGICYNSAVHVGTACVACAPGTFLPYFSYSWTKCLECDAGTYSSQPASKTCTSCPPGTIQPRRGAAQCNDCAPGSYSSSFGSIVCLSCPPNGFEPRSGATACTQCTQGSYRLTSTSLQCVLCGPGHYQPALNQSSCLSCQPGLYQNGEGASTCAACAPGSYQPSPNATACLSCPGGWYQPGTNASACFPCAPGFAQPSAGAASCADACESGAYQSGYASTACLACTPGWYQPVAQATACLACSPSQYQPSAGGVGCDECTSNQYQPWANASACLECSACPAGSFRSAGCHDRLTDGRCQPCTECAGPLVRACSQNQDAVCGRLSPCPLPPEQGYAPWMLDGTVLPEDFTCPRPGQYLSTFNAGARSPQCLPCPDGMVGLDRILCVPCPPGQFPYADHASCICQPPAVLNASGGCECPDGLIMTGSGCQPCPPNTYGRARACAACAPGTYSDAGATVCDACPVGQYRAEGQPRCASCGPNRYPLDPSVPTSCESCQPACSIGQQVSPCRVNSLLVECAPCPDPPENAERVEGPDCPYRCLPGYYHAGGGCQACAVTACGNGSVLTPCSLLQDGNCEVPCANGTMPAERAWYGNGCEWVCEPGHVATLVDYWIFSYYVCVPG